MTSFEPYDVAAGIAVIGMSGRFPGAKDVESFWRNLRAGVESISFFSRNELETSGVDPALLSHPDFVGAGGVLDDIELFDASFFGFNPREAEVLDPQQRLFMECAWQALEDAGYVPEGFDGSVGVYGGAALSTYLFNLISNRDVMAMVGSFQVLLGNDKDHLTTHVSYKLNLTGPSVAVQTACSTSLVAVCMACQSLLDHQCDMALAGGVGIKVPQKTGYLYQEGMINSPDGHCRTFDAKAKGTVGGSGVGLVVLRRLADAIAEGDNIYAVIKGSAINNDGSLKVGYTAPSVQGQAEVIAMAQALADVSPETISYVETHGTATPLGDPIEIAALTQAFRASTQKKNFCGIGSVKSNIGHLDTAAGVAGLIKAVLMLKHKMLPPSLHFTQPNPAIDFANSPFYVNASLASWGPAATPRRAAVSSFGIGGTNAHAILEEAPKNNPASPSRQAQLVLLSAKTETALNASTANMARHLMQHSDTSLPDLAYTCQVGRRVFSHRLMLVCKDPDDAASALEMPDPARVFRAVCTQEKPVVFMFPGQGAQYMNMTRELYEVELTFRRQVDLCSELLRPVLGQDVRKLIYPDPDGSEKAASQLELTAFTQPALFVVEYALARLLMEWGVIPRSMIGHSIGEYVAACLAGVFSLEDALRMVATRGRMMQEMPGGSMLSVPLGEESIRAHLNGNLDLAAINGTSLCVVSGPVDAVGELEIKLRDQGVHSQRLHTSHGFHSRMMDPLLEPFTQLMHSVDLRPPSIPYISNVTGGWVTAEEATTPEYWARHLRRTVRFAAGVKLLLKGSDSILLEVGPGETLSTLVRQHPDRTAEQITISSVRRPQTQQSDEAVLLNALGRLWLSGASIKWSGFYTHERRRRISLPTYPFERQRYWVDPRPAVSASAQSDASITRRDISDWFYTPSWKPTIATQEGISASPTTWLAFTDKCGLGDPLTEKLRLNGDEVFVITAGTEFSVVGDHQYTIRSRVPDDYHTLITKLRSMDRLPQKIVHLWSLTSKPRPAEPETFDQQQAMGFFSLLFLVQALGAHHVSDPIQLKVISNRIHSVTGDEVVEPGKATVLAPCKVIPQEYPNIRCQQIDLVLPDSQGDTERLLDQLTRELNAAEPADTVIAYRGVKRWAQSYEKARLDSSPDKIPLLRERGVYLITGGLGNIGLELAEELARTVRARLVLIGRSDFPPKENWTECLLTRGEHDPISRKIRRLQAIEELGAEVVVLAADVADESQMQNIVNQILARFGGINGVIHGAGTTTTDAFCAIYQSDRAIADRHFQPKAHGISTLEAVLRKEKIDFWVLLSSLSAVLGGLGFVAYSAANIFMDAFAARRNQQQAVPWITIDWDGWNFRGDAHLDAAAAGAESGVLPQEGVEAFRRILTRGSLHHVVVSAGDLDSRIAQWINLESLKKTPQSSTESAELHARPALATQYVAPRNKVEQTIAATWQDLLGIERVGVYDNFFELGGHSLIAIQIISRLRDAFHVELSVQTLFEAPTVADLATTIEKNNEANKEEMDKVTQMLQFVEQLSESEINDYLAQAE